MKVVGAEARVRVLEGQWDVGGVAREIVAAGVQEDPFYILDLGDVVAKFRKWKQAMPRVEPFYAVKCNDDPTLLTTLAALGTGFDCASKSEIGAVMQLGVRPERIIFANPAKIVSHIRYAGAAGVRTMTFDNEMELMKMKHYLPDAKLVIRIRCDAAECQIPLGNKFGCDPVTEAPRLLKLAAVLGLEVVGVSFHVGSGCRESAVYGRAVHLARVLFDLGACVGHPNMRLLDIGGGFPGNSDTSIDEIASIVNSSLEMYFPDSLVQVIAEPGRFFAASAYTLAVQVHSKREVVSKAGTEGVGQEHTMYFINDGVYGSFNCVLCENRVVQPEPLQASVGKATSCSVWGPSCDGLDCVVGTCQLPPLAVGDWLLFRNMGAYSLSLATTFNGFPLTRVRSVIDHCLWGMVKSLWPLTEAHFVLGERMTGPQIFDEPPALALDTPPGSPPPPRPHDPMFVECALKWLPTTPTLSTFPLHS